MTEDNLLDLALTAERTGDPLLIADTAEKISTILYLAQDALAHLIPAANYHRLTLHAESIADDLIPVHSALADISLNERDDQ